MKDKYNYKLYLSCVELIIKSIYSIELNLKSDL